MKLQRKIKRNIERILAGAALAAMLATPAFALPQNPNVVVGNGQIIVDNGAGGIMNIAVGANGVIDWSSFSIASGESVNFNFSDTLAVLNRVTGTDMSVLNGALNSTGNGSIFLVNPNGVLVGQGATINANNLVLSTLDVDNAHFMNWANKTGDTLSFDKGSQAGSAKAITVESGINGVNESLILIGGSVSIAPNISIESTGGNIFVAAADKAVLHKNGGMDITATPNNSITLDNANILNPSGDVFLLGGKVEMINATGTNGKIEGRQVWIGAGSKVGITAADEGAWYYFSPYFKSGQGNTVTVGQGATLIGHDESGILANAITNAGRIESPFSLDAYDERANDGRILAISGNNKIINKGTISFTLTGYEEGHDSVLDIAGGSFDNTDGTIEISGTRGDGSTDGVVFIYAKNGVKGVDLADNRIKVLTGDLTDPNIPSNPDIDEILNGGGSFEAKQEQIIAVVKDINQLPSGEQGLVITGVMGSIAGNTDLSMIERNRLLNSVVNTYEGTAAGKKEADNQTSVNQSGTTGDANNSGSMPAFVIGESENPIIIEQQ